MSDDKYDILVVGSGESGKYLAWTMAAAGCRTAVIERKLIGGSCPNIACLPSKNIIHSAKVKSLAMRGAEFGRERQAQIQVATGMEGAPRRHRGRDRRWASWRWRGSCCRRCAGRPRGSACGCHHPARCRPRGRCRCPGWCRQRTRCRRRGRSPGRRVRHRQSRWARRSRWQWRSCLSLHLGRERADGGRAGHRSAPAEASASAPPTISLISWVISACRAWLARRV